MIRRLFIIGGAAVFVLFAVVGILYYMGGKTPNVGAGFFSRIGGGVSVLTGSRQAAEQMAVSPEFAFRRLEVDTSKARAEACLVFTRTLDQSGRTHYEDYLAIDPATKVVVRPLDQRLCIAGFDFNKTYSVTLKTGLPDSAGEKLTEPETVPVQLADKPAIVRFNGGIILPRDNADGVPITTVNVSRLRLKVVRVGDRLLSQIESGSVDETTLESYDESQLETNQGAVVWKGTMDVAMVKNDSVVTLIPSATS